MLGEGVEIDSLATHTLLRSLTLSGEWAVALFVFERALEVAPEVCTSTVFAAALEACAAGAQRERALALLQQMSARGVYASAACYHGVCAACAADGDAQAALGALQDMLRQDMAPQPRTWRVVHDACRAAGRDDDADQLSEYAERLGVPLLAAESEPA